MRLLDGLVFPDGTTQDTAAIAGPAALSEIAYGEGLALVSAANSSSVWTTVPGTTIVVPAGQAFDIEAYANVIQYLGAAAAGIAYNVNFRIYDVTNAAGLAATLNGGYAPVAGTGAANGTTGNNVSFPVFVRRRMSALAAPTTYRMEFQPNGGANMGAAAVWSNFNTTPYYVKASTR